ncbi:MAG: SUMF1/EgtB/PvdO family nonheme iron enzyme [Terricaulis sp.]
MAELFRYAAFISYSSKDAGFAKRLHRQLESYRIPPSLGRFVLSRGGKKNRIYPVFRDREELAAGNLGDAIEANLNSSAALIVVCSPNAATSAWVQKEIEYFARTGRRERIFAIVADSAPTKGPEESILASFPPAFRGDALSGDKLQPLAADARDDKDGFRGACLKLIAGLIGVMPGQLIDRDKRERRKRLFGGLVLSLAPLMLLGLIWLNWSALLPLTFADIFYRPYVHTAAVLRAGSTGARSRFQDCRAGSADCPAMIVIPQGSFLMGSRDGPPPGDAMLPDTYTGPQQDELPQHPVTLQRFAVSENDITFEDWNACVRAGGCLTTPHPDDSQWGRGQRPVIDVTWQDAQEYAAWLSRMTGKSYRLLTEAEWEYAARGETAPPLNESTYAWGNELPVCRSELRNGVNFDACPQSQTTPVGAFKSNRFGLYDTVGNVWQWIEDCYGPYDPSLGGAAVETEAKPYTSCARRVIRGGAWSASADQLRITSRRSLYQGARENDLGFRVARTL